MLLKRESSVAGSSSQNFKNIRRWFLTKNSGGVGSIKHSSYSQLFQCYHHHCRPANIKSRPLFSLNPDISSRNLSRCPSLMTQNLSFYKISNIRLASTASNTLNTSTSSLAQTPVSSTLEITDSEFANQLSKGINLNESLEPTAEALLHAPEKIGYLKSVGLDWGWGPTSVVEYVMEHLHVYMGAPWWVTITVTAILVRVALFRPYISSAENATRMAIVNPIAKPILDKMMAAQKAGDQAGFFQYKQEQTLIYKRAGVKMWKSGIPLIQMVIGFGTFRLLNGMAKLPVPGLETGGTLWFQNLSVADPLYILPLATAATLHWVMKKGGETGVQTMNPKMLSLLKWGLPLISLVFTSWLPAGVQLTFFISGLLSLTQASLLRQPWLRSYFRMTQLPTSNVSETPNLTSPYKGNIRIAQSSYLSQAELSERFKAPDLPVKYSELDNTSLKQNIAEQKPKGSFKQILAGAVTDIKGTVKEVVETGRNFAGNTKKEVQGRLDKAEIRQRELYEKKKQEEEWNARLEEQRLRRIERKKRKHHVLSKSEKA
ncbi:Mitochondrial inner membrane protein OXA1 [Erysiphe neolycopersici]|uniref:Mitochondrial inner membrane protein OXA1 n=1 Tax=Erysiphe neolycopersici TaxID=212602 RepID=A0A420HAF3_9PEZI|nr:Mitochondrial inner membrane protein OXA1 [Erysiphe neolycopersici]